jgi:hypothetical protein
MKYLEELSSGDCFVLKDSFFLITSDFKKDKKLCYSLLNGSPRWLENNTIIDDIQLYTLDNSNNIIPIKHTKK